MTKYSGAWNLLLAQSPLVVFAATLAAESLAGTFSLGEFIALNGLTSVSALVTFTLSSLSYGVLEEIGWRGFLLPRLQRKFNALLATVILTVFWAAWHTPAFFYRPALSGFLSSPIMPLVFYLLVLTGSIMLTSIFNSSGGSLLMVIIWHITYDLFSSNQTGMANTTLVVFFTVFDLFVIIKYGVRSLSKSEKVTI